MAFFKPKKELGQNFLKDSKVLDRIVSVINISPEDTVIEIGPGHGELTRRILKENPKKVIAIEKDSELIEKFLDELIKENFNLEVVNEDALQYIPNLKNSYKLIGNIPYYITGALLRILGEIENKPEIVALTLQKEVAERLCANPPKMNLLAASVQLWGKPELIRYISRKSFKPAPKVGSAIITITPRKRNISLEESEKYYKTIHKLFNSPRKTIANNLKPLVAKEDLQTLGFDSKLRPQDLSIEDIKKISSLFTRQDA